MRAAGVDYLVVDGRHFSADFLARRAFYFEPFNGYVARLVAGRKGGFALQRLAARQVLFGHGHLLVVSSESLVRGEAGGS